MKKRFACLLLGIGLIGIAHDAQISLHADVIHLKNGRRMDGRVIQETERQVTFDLGLGAMTLDKEQIARIERTGDGTQNAPDTPLPWSAPASTSIPACTQVEQLVAPLAAKRQAARQAQRQLDQLQRQQDMLTGEIRQIEQRAESQERQITGAQADVSNYNQLVTRFNELASRITAKQQELQNSAGSSANRSRNLQEELQGLIKQSVELQTQIDATRSQADSGTQLLEHAGGVHARYESLQMRTKNLEHQMKPLQETVTTYVHLLEEIEQELQPLLQSNTSSDGCAQAARLYQQRLEEDFDSASITGMDQSGGIVVPVTINRTVTARMVLDTGASIVTLSRALANRLQIREDSGKAVELTLANGARVTGREITLESLQTGGAKAEQVRAVILPEPPGEGADGLLGMSFLSQFIMSMDPSGNRLILRKLKRN